MQQISVIIAQVFSLYPPISVSWAITHTVMMEVKMRGIIVKKTDEIIAKEYFLTCFKSGRMFKLQNYKLEKSEVMFYRRIPKRITIGELFPPNP